MPKVRLAAKPLFGHASVIAALTAAMEGPDAERGAMFLKPIDLDLLISTVRERLQSA